MFGLAMFIFYLSVLEFLRSIYIEISGKQISDVGPIFISLVVGIASEVGLRVVAGGIKLFGGNSSAKIDKSDLADIPQRLNHRF